MARHFSATPRVFTTRAGGGYLAASVPPSIMVASLKVLGRMLVPSDYERAVLAREDRDRTSVGHVTLVTPQEYMDTLPMPVELAYCNRHRVKYLRRTHSLVCRA
jgi:hypothetical protein